MALPSSGLISASMINTEAARVSTTIAPTGGSGGATTPSAGSLVLAYNNATPSPVDQNDPYAYSEFYGKSFVPVNIPCGGVLNAGSGNGYFEATVTSGSATGAIVIYFNPVGVPDGIAFEYNNTTYNDLTSNTYGYAAGTGNNLNIVGDDDIGNCKAANLISNSPYTLNTSIWNGSSFGLNGGTTTVVTTNVNLNGTVGGITYTLVVPKPDTSPTTGILKIVGPCSGTAWGVKVLCPATLPSFTTNSVQSTFQGSCCATQNQTFYFARNASSGTTADTNTLPQVGNFVFNTNRAANVLANGYYRITSNTAIYVQNGVVSSISTGCTTCLTSYSSSVETVNLSNMCSASLNQTFYHDGSGVLPTINDKCYSDAGSSNVLVGGYYRTSSGGGILINNNTGTVTSLQTCLVSFLTNTAIRRDACVQGSSDATWYHDNPSGTYPAIGDIVYDDQAGTTPVPGGQRRWFFANGSGGGTYDVEFANPGSPNTGIVNAVGTCI